MKTYRVEVDRQSWLIDDADTGVEATVQPVNRMPDARTATPTTLVLVLGQPEGHGVRQRPAKIDLAARLPHFLARQVPAPSPRRDPGRAG